MVIAAAKRPPPKPRAAVKLELAPRNRFIELKVARLAFRPFDTALIAGALDTGLASGFSKAMKAHERLEGPASAQLDLQSDLHSCIMTAEMAANADPDADPNCAEEKALTAKLTKAEAAYDKVQTAELKALDKSYAVLKQSYEQQPRAAAALALTALAAQREAIDGAADMMGYEQVRYGTSYVFGALPAPDNADLTYLKRARSSSRADTDIGVEARYQLVVASYLDGQLEAAREVLEELQGVMSGRLAKDRRSLLYLLGVLRAAGPRADYEAAARTLTRAAQAKSGSDGPSDRELTLARLMASYRAGDRQQALTHALSALALIHKPPPPPLPPPPSPPGGLGTGGILGSSQLGIIGLLAQPSRGYEMGAYGEERLAADCIEHIGLDKADLSKASPLVRAHVLLRLAVRALHRHDHVAANKAIALALEQPPSGALLSTLKGLPNLMRQSADRGDVSKLKTGILPPLNTMGMIGVLGKAEPSIEQLERDELFGSKGGSFDVERTFGSLMRLCLEADYWRLDNLGTAVKVKISTYDDHPVDVEVTPAKSVDLERFKACLGRHAPRLFARSPNSVAAAVDLSQVTTKKQVAYGLMGTGEGFGGLGAHGPGLGGVLAPGAGRGGGGMGLRGTGGGGRGYGSGTGVLGKPKVNKKKKPRNP